MPPPLRSAQAAAGAALALLALSTLNSKIAGTLWGLTFIVTAILAVRARSWPASDALDRIARLWVIATTLGLTCWIVSAAVWDELYPQHSAEINAGLRLVTGALAAYWLTRVVRFAPSARASHALTLALSIACVVALLVAQLIHERDRLPIHAIAWASGIGLIIVLLVARAADSNQSARSRAVAALGVLAGALAILGSQSRAGTAVAQAARVC
jgi:FtsH-binding integral membrane protein